jgi:putative colanic acid biosynthesis acetyltransferase WcaF
VRLDQFDNSGYQRGRSRLIEVLWLLLQVLIASWIPGSGWRVQLLRLFGARIGRGCVLKPRLRVKFPWRLQVGDHVWLGESVWIDNLSDVQIGKHVCISQGAYLCTGSHDFRDPAFALLTKPITLEDEVWVGAFVRLAPGCVLHRGAVVSMGLTVSGVVPAYTVLRSGPGSIIQSPRYKDRP